MAKDRWWLAVPFAVGVMVVNVLLHFCYMLIYSYLIMPGRDEAFYEAHALASAPFSSIIAGMPLMFLAGRLIGSRFSAANRVKAALAVWLVYLLLDFVIVSAAGVLIPMAAVIAISLATKLVGAYLGGLAAARAATAS